MLLVAWSLAAAASLHILEEFVFPGGFKSWWCAYRPETAGSVSNGFLIVINAALLAFSAAVAVAVQAPRGNGVAAWLALAALLFSNAIFHLIGAFQSKRYSPGMITGIALYIPLAIYGFAYFLRERTRLHPDSARSRFDRWLLSFHFVRQPSPSDSCSCES